MITTLSNKIAHFLISVSHTEPEPEQIEVYIYGLECFLYAPTDTSKYDLTDSMRKKEKFCSVSILIIGFVVALILKNEISISILYSDVCVCTLLLMKVIIQKVKS